MESALKCIRIIEKRCPVVRHTFEGLIITKLIHSKIINPSKVFQTAGCIFSLIWMLLKLIPSKKGEFILKTWKECDGLFSVVVWSQIKREVCDWCLDLGQNTTTIYNQANIICCSIRQILDRHGWDRFSQIHISHMVERWWKISHKKSIFIPRNHLDFCLEKNENIVI